MRAQAIFILAVSLAGCVGEIGGTDRTDAAAPEQDAAAVPMRRLTQVEYRYTVNDLLGVDSTVIDDFEPDEAIGGFESNGVVAVSPTMVQRYRDAAEALAGALDPSVLAPCESGADEAGCAAAFVRSVGRRLYRRSLGEPEIEQLVALYQERRSDHEHGGAVRIVVAAMLQSPHFLYRVELPDPAAQDAAVPLDAFELATRVSYFLWASAPDDALLDAAEAGALETTAGLREQAERMLADPKSSRSSRSFFRQWLLLDALARIDKSPALYPAFTPEVRGALFEQAMLFGDDVAALGPGGLRALFTAPYGHFNATLQAYVPGNAVGEAFERVDLSPVERGGALTLPGFLAVQANASEGSPILRGRFVRQAVLCQAIPPPPPDVANSPPAVDPTVPTKERFAQHVADPSCAACHDLMDPIGFGFMHYDAIGAYTNADGNFPVDATGELIAAGDASGPFHDAVDLMTTLAESEEVARCMSATMLRFALGRPDRDRESASVDAIHDALEGSDGDFAALRLAVVESPAFRLKRAP